MSTDDRPDALRAVVAMATFRRPDCLDRILPLLLTQVAASPVPTHLLVVDNDPEGGARAQVEAYADRGVRYVHEPRPGIASARNRALSESSDVDLLLFIDDDEVPGDDWLTTMLDAWSRWRCAAVVGPVEPDYEIPVDDWILGTRVFERGRRPSGSVVRGAATNNLLLDLRVLRAHGLQFDEAFGLTGGSDSMLTWTLSREGGEIRWCDEAPVVDVIPASRLTRRWVFRRTVRTSNAYSRVNLALEGTPSRRLAARASLTAHGAYRTLRGAAQWTAGSVSRREEVQGAGACDVARGVGMTLGAWGYVWAEYKRS